MIRKEIIKKASELSNEYAITTHRDGYDVTEYPDVTMLYKMAEWVQSEMTAKVYHALENILSKQVLDGLVKILKEE